MNWLKNLLRRLMKPLELAKGYGMGTMRIKEKWPVRERLLVATCKHNWECTNVQIPSFQCRKCGKREDGI